MNENNHTVQTVSKCRKNSHWFAFSDEDCLTFLALGASKGELQASTDTTYMKNTHSNGTGKSSDED